MNKFIIIGLVGFISYHLIVPRMVTNMAAKAITNMDVTAMMNFSNNIGLFQLWWYGSVIMLVIGIIIFIKNLNK
tara:strand:- start:151 stop:372 length:222 start_codon:yes stop_codon:yes gene_type:complete